MERLKHIIFRNALNKFRVITRHKSTAKISSNISPKKWILLPSSCVIAVMLYNSSTKEGGFIQDALKNINFYGFIHFLPFEVASTLWGKINSQDLPSWMRSKVYDSFCRTYNCDMSEALESDYQQYRNLGEFFTRRLRPELRPISQEPGIVSPADGQILHFGPIKDGKIEQVKNIDYSVQTFLGLPSDNYDRLLFHGKEKSDLYHCIIYLAPGDYHRFHSPTRWTVKRRRHLPGRLLSVRPSVLERMPEILHTNERVCYIGHWDHGFFSMTAVGATNVGSIKVSFDEELKTNEHSFGKPIWHTKIDHEFGQGVKLTAGQDFGQFNFGSTIVLIFEAPKNTSFDLVPNQKIKYGQLLSKVSKVVQPKSTNPN